MSVRAILIDTPCRRSFVRRRKPDLCSYLHPFRMHHFCRKQNPKDLLKQKYAHLVPNKRIQEINQV